MSPNTYTVEHPEGVLWEVDKLTGVGRRLTPAAGRSFSRKPVEMTRSFPIPDPDPKTLDRATLLSLCAASAIRSQAVLSLLAISHDAPEDDRAARNRLASQSMSTFHGIRNFDLDVVVASYLALRQQS
jgi:hypothetical protein